MDMTTNQRFIERKRESSPPLYHPGNLALMISSKSKAENQRKSISPFRYKLSATKQLMDRKKSVPTQQKPGRMNYLLNDFNWQDDPLPVKLRTMKNDTPKFE